MAGILRKVWNKTNWGLVNLLGMNFNRLGSTLVNSPRFVGELLAYRRRARGSEFPLRMKEISPLLHDASSQAGYVDGHYFLQDIWMAQQIKAAAPGKHYDIGSRIDGFISHLLVFMPVTVIDIRPLAIEAPGLEFLQSDATKLALPDQSVESISTLHAIEHFGLARYGDTLDPEDWKTALAELQRVLRPGGRLYLSVPVGRQRVVFNSHRVFDPRTIIQALPELELVRFAAINDQERLVDPARPEELAQANYGCGLFVFTRPPA